MTRSYKNAGRDTNILESAKCREIVAEIMNFGVSQHQIETLIRLLALELEDRNKMIAIRNCIESFENNSIETSEIIT